MYNIFTFCILSVLYITEDAFYQKIEHDGTPNDIFPFKIHKKINIKIAGKHQVSHQTPLGTLKKIWGQNLISWITRFNNDGITKIEFEQIDNIVFISLMLRYRCHLCDHDEQEDVAFEDNGNNQVCESCGLYQHLQCPKHGKDEIYDTIKGPWFCHLCDTF